MKNAAIPAMMRTSGTPSATPTIMPRLEVLREWFWLAPSAVLVASMVMTWVTVSMEPSLPVVTVLCVNVVEDIVACARVAGVVVFTMGVGAVVGNCLVDNSLVVNVVPGCVCVRNVPSVNVAGEFVTVLAFVTGDVADMKAISCGSESLKYSVPAKRVSQQLPASPDLDISTGHAGWSCEYIRFLSQHQSPLGH